MAIVPAGAAGGGGGGAMDIFNHEMSRDAGSWKSVRTSLALKHFSVVGPSRFVDVFMDPQCLLVCQLGSS